jgi:hypothetical protein
MTKLLTEVMRKVAELPEDRQEDAAHVLLAMLENDASPYRLTDDQLRFVERASPGAVHRISRSTLHRMPAPLD